MAQFTVHDAKTNLSRLIADALAGGDVVIARGNVPAVRLVPVKAQGRRTFGGWKATRRSVLVLAMLFPMRPIASR